MSEEPAEVRAADLRPGMLVDLEGDIYADPDGNEIRFVYQYMEVWKVEADPYCVSVAFRHGDGSGFRGYLFGFPPEHLLTVAEAANDA